MADALSERNDTLLCSCGWTGSDWAAAKDHVVANMGKGVTHEVMQRLLPEIYQEGWDAAIAGGWQSCPYRNDRYARSWVQGRDDALADALEQERTSA